MTQQIKQFGFLILFALSIFLTSCETDQNNNLENNNSTLIKEVTLQELKNDLKFLSVFSKKFNNKSFETFIGYDSQQNSIIINEFDFYLPEKKAKIITTDSLTSYNFLIKRNETSKNYFENLVIQINNRNQYSANIIKYYPKKFEINQQHKTFSLDSDKELVPINNSTVGKINNSLQSESQTCITVSYSICNQGGKDHIAGPNCTQIYKNVSDTVCFTSEPGGGGSGDGSWGWSNGGTNTSGGGNDTGSGSFNITTAPVDPMLDLAYDGELVTYSESYNALYSQIFYNNLAQEVKDWSTNNPETYNIFLTNIISNNWSNQSIGMSKWAMEFLNNNPSVTWEQFSQFYNNQDVINYLGQNFNDQGKQFIEQLIQYRIANPDITLEQLQNWFFGSHPKTDGEEVINPDLITFDTPVIVGSLPSFNEFTSAFPKNGTSGNYSQMSANDVYNLIGGSLLNSYNNDVTNSYSNACSIRGSRGLLYSSITIPVLRYNGLQRTQKGGDLKNYILDAVSFNTFMKAKFGEAQNVLTGVDANDPIKVANFLKGKNGIYVIINNNPSSNGAGYSGHVDTIINGICIGNAYTRPKGGIKSIRIWTLN